MSAGARVIHGAALATVVLVAGCDAALLRDLDEPGANDVVTLLAEAGIPARKVAEGAGTYRVEVDRRDLPAAWTLVREAGHPRGADDEEAAPRLVVGPTEAAARRRHRQARALEALLRAAPGVVDARVVLGDDRRVAAVVRLEAATGAPAAAAERLRGLLAAGAGVADPGGIALEVHRARAPPPRAAGAPRDLRPFLLAAGAAILLLAALCLALLVRLRRLRRALETAGAGLRDDPGGS